MTDADADPGHGVWRGRFALTTVAANALIVLAAFDSLAVATIMPTVARELDGRSLYAAAFSATLAAQVIGTVAAGALIDRRGPVVPLVTAVGLFAAGLALAATAVSMPVFVAGRFVQGLGLGAVVVALYVIVGRAYPPRLHPSVFATFAAAWVVPGLVGPAVAGALADTIGWPWVFAGLGVLVLGALAVLAPTLARLKEPPGRERRDPAQEPEEGTASRSAPGPRLGVRLAACVLLAVAVVAISSATELPTGAAWAVGGVAVVAAVVLLVPLVPRGVLTARRGLGSTILLRGVVAGAFFSTEVRLPLMLQTRYGLAPYEAGLVLTVATLAWAGASNLQPRLPARVGQREALGVGTVLVALGVGVELAAAALSLPVAVVGVGWFVAAAGMGTVYPRVSTLTLAQADPAMHGFASSALSTLEAVAGAMAIALAGLVFVSAGGVDSPGAFAAAIALSTAVAVAAVPVALRVVAPHAGGPTSAAPHRSAADTGPLG